MRAIALLKPKVRVIAIVCAAENMPDGKAQKPGDVQTAMPLNSSKPGKTIEIINTDAEGRLVLADGLTYARQLGATRPAVTAPIIGPRTMEQFEGSLRSLEITLEEQTLKALDTIFPGHRPAPEDYAW